MCFVLIDEAIHMQRLSEKTHQFLGSCFPRQCRYIISAGEKKQTAVRSHTISAATFLPKIIEIS